MRTWCETLQGSALEATMQEASPCRAEEVAGVPLEWEKDLPSSWCGPKGGLRHKCVCMQLCAVSPDLPLDCVTFGGGGQML